MWLDVGCAPFAEAKDSKGNPIVAVNLRCTENVDLTKIKISPFDGAHLL